MLCLSDLKAAGGGNILLLFGHIQTEHAVGVAGLDAVGVDTADVKAAAAAAVEALTLDIIAALVLAVLLAAGGDGQAVVFNINADDLSHKP